MEKITYNKDDLVKKLSQKILFSHDDMKFMVDNFLETILEILKQPKDVIRIDIDLLKDIGLSKQKTNYIIGLAEYFCNADELIDFNLLSNSEVSSELIQIKGVGQWTIDMFLMFTLLRLDVLPVADLGIKKGMKILFNMKDLPLKDEMIIKANIWRPYRSIACCYLWRIVDDEDFW